MTVKIYALANGRDIIGEVVREDDTTIFMKKPLMAILMQNEKNEPVLNFAPLSPLLNTFAIEDLIPVAKSAVVFGPSDPEPELANVYRNNVSPIQMINQKIVPNGFTRN